MYNDNHSHNPTAAMNCQQLPLKSRQVAGLVLLALSGLGFGGCGTPPPPSTSASPAEVGAADRPLVVATTSLVCDLTRQIAADTVNLKCLVAAGTDPHIYEPQPEDQKAIEQAKLILYSGYNFETRLVKLIKATPNPALKVAVNELAVPNPEKFEEDGKIEPDPHVFHSAANGIQAAEVIRKTLTQLLPNNASTYTASTQKVTGELAQIDAWIKMQIATIPMAQRKLVTTHDAFGYYSKAYGIPVIGALEGVSTDEKPTATRVKELVQTIKAAGVPTVFVESSINPKLIEAVAKEASVKVASQELFADGPGEKGGPAQTYQAMLTTNTKTLVEGLGGTYAPFIAK
jgi:manganese/iron transport system substrate-binding protein